MSNIKEIWCMPHSHLDIGYTHPQKMLLELQCDYIDQAIDLIVKTKDYPEESRFHWCCEATYPVEKWFRTATKERQDLFRSLVREGYLSVCALPVHFTPNVNTLQMTDSLEHVQEIRKLTGSPVNIAISHDVNGQPWTLGSLLLDSGIDFYLTGLNIHFGGIPFPRPYAFAWETPDGRRLTSFLGEHYSLFSQLFFTDLGSTEKMHEGIVNYIERIDQSGWDQDFVFLTATNPPLLDNNSPDENLSDLIRRYNEEGHEQRIRLVSPQTLKQAVMDRFKGTLPVERGDWTDYWNFGCASLAREQKIGRKAKTNLWKSEFLAALDADPEDARTKQLTAETYEQALLFDEHTWGAWECVTDPDNEETLAQIIHKQEMADNAAELSAFLLGKRMERLAGNPRQSDTQEGCLLVNPTGETIEYPLWVPQDFQTHGRNLSAMRLRNYLPYERQTPIDATYYGTVTLSPYCMRQIPMGQIFRGDFLSKWTQEEIPSGITPSLCDLGSSSIGQNFETSFYKVELDENTGWIRQITDRKTGRRLLNEDASWNFFDLVEERVDKRFSHKGRRAMFDKDVEKVNANITQWQHGWHALRTGITEKSTLSVQKNPDWIRLTYRSETDKCKNLIQQITFLRKEPRILLDVSFQKERETDPLGIYLALPLRLTADWECVYDTADSFVQLDQDQLGNVCRDYLTTDRAVSIFDQNGGCTLACPDAPMVQIGDFHFGCENHAVPREENPLLLAWPMNNYWDTNFPASEEGRQSFHYELTFFEKFDRGQMFAAGILAKSPVITGTIVSCKEDSWEQFLELDGADSRILFLRPDRHATEAENLRNKDGSEEQSRPVFLALKNISDHETECRIAFPHRTIQDAKITDLNGNTQKKLKIAEGGVLIPQQPNAITFVRMQLV